MNLVRRCYATPVLSLITALLAVTFSSANAQSGPSPAPDMPLPPCTFVEGQWHGACPADSDVLSGYAAGRFSLGSPVTVWTDPTIDVCNRWVANTGEYSVSPCYSRVSAPVVVGCATIDLLDGERFRELACNQALYLDTAGLPNPLFTMQRPSGYEDWNGSTACGANPDYRTYVEGGPATQVHRVWRTRGPLALPCEITFQGPHRPDGLYGPTWVKVRVQITHAETGTDIYASIAWAEFYVPIDGDLRFDNVDVAVEAEGSVTDADWDNGRVMATYTATVTNSGESDAENVTLTAAFPIYLSVQDVSDDRCRLGNAMPGYTGGSPLPGTSLKAGGGVECSFATMAPEDSVTVTLAVRILNASDLHALQEGLIPNAHHATGVFRYAGVGFVVNADGDAIESNNEAVVAIDIPFRSGSYSQTREAMRLLDQHLSYTGAPMMQACNNYQEDIIARLRAVHNEHGHVFDNLSYGGVTSGNYQIAGIDHDWATAGHVGVVIYAKGTNYRETGIIVNGTPWPSPGLNFASEHGHFAAGLDPLTSTALSGSYLLTPADRYPGFPLQEGAQSSHFEGMYIHNGSEFVAGGGIGPEPEAPPMAGLTCPFAPDTVVVATASPVEIIVTNPQGQRVETDNGRIVTQELDGTIFAMSFPHEDGTYGWSLGLPVDDYDVQLRGIADGTYELMLLTFEHDGTPIEEVTLGSTWPGLVEQFTVTAPAAAPPVTPPPTTPVQPGPPPPAQRSGGGSALPLWMLFVLGGLTLLRRQRQR